MKLLIAEDDPKLLKSLIHILETNKYSVDGVNNGDDALSYGLTGEYDGLILDIMMPGMDGLKVLQSLRASNITTPALFLTARTEVSDRVEGLDAGADDYLPKPFSTVELFARIRAMLRRKDTYLPDLLTVGWKRISNFRNVNAATRSYYFIRAFYYTPLGLGHQCGYQCDLGSHLQSAKKDQCNQCSDGNTFYSKRRLCVGG